MPCVIAGVSCVGVALRMVCVGMRIRVVSSWLLSGHPVAQRDVMQRLVLLLRILTLQSHMLCMYAVLISPGRKNQAAKAQHM